MARGGGKAAELLAPRTVGTLSQKQAKRATYSTHRKHYSSCSMVTSDASTLRDWR